MVKHSKTIAIASVIVLVLVLVVAWLAGPRQLPTTNDDDQQTHLTDEQQDRVNERLDHCFSTGDC